MAVIIPSALIAEISGSVGSQCFGRNLGGAYVRAKPIIPPSSTARQIAARANMAAATLAWQTITDAQRAMYVMAAANYQTRFRLGRSNQISGYNLFIRQYLLQKLAGLTPAVSNPAPRMDGIYNMSSVAISFSTFAVTLIRNGSNADTYYALYASNQLSAGLLHPNPHLMVKFKHGQFGAGTSALNVYTDYFAIFGSPISGTRIAVGVRSFNPKSAEETVIFQRSILVA